MSDSPSPQEGHDLSGDELDKSFEDSEDELDYSPPTPGYSPSYSPTKRVEELEDKNAEFGKKIDELEDKCVKLEGKIAQSSATNMEMKIHNRELKEKMRELEDLVRNLEKDKEKSNQMLSMKTSFMANCIDILVEMNDVNAEEKIRRKTIVKMMANEIRCSDTGSTTAQPILTTPVQLAVNCDVSSLSLPSAPTHEVGPIRKKPSTSHTSKTLKKPECKLCKRGDHKTADCNIISDPAERLKIAKKFKLCLICCLHSFNVPCRFAKKPCEKCRKKGHQKVFCRTK